MKTNTEFKLIGLGLGIVMYMFSPSTWQTEVGRALGAEASMITSIVSGQLGLHSESLSQKQNLEKVKPNHNNKHV